MAISASPPENDDERHETLWLRPVSPYLSPPFFASRLILFICFPSHPWLRGILEKNHRNFKNYFLEYDNVKII